MKQKELIACLPVVFSIEGNLQWAMTSNGALIRIDADTWTSGAQSEVLCPNCIFMDTQTFHGGPFDGMVIELVGRSKNWVFYNADSKKMIRNCNMEDIQGAEIADCQRCSKGLVLLATYPDQRSSHLLLYKTGTARAEVLSELGFRYMKSGGLAVSDQLNLIACKYGKSPRAGHDLVLVNLDGDKISEIITDHESPISACCFIEEHDLLISGDLRGAIKFWYVSSGELMETIKPGVINVLRIQWLNTHQALLILGCRISSKSRKEELGRYEEPIFESVLFAWKLSEGGPPKITHCGDWDEHCAVDFTVSPDQSELITGDPQGSTDSTIKWWPISEILE